jgi:hypothetical protein
MLVRAVKSFGGSKYGHKPAGSVFELPEGVDWLQAGLVEPVEQEIETASVEAPETAVKPKAKRRVTKRKGAVKKK